ncbi:MAG: penicillin-binding protein 2 [Desulfobacterales bacterium]|jgi:cell division protein FtsI (penicillin-binding protein 3)
MEKKYINLREILIGIMFILLLSMVGARAVQVQIYDGPWLSKQASNQYERSFTTFGRRGTIYDRNFREMAVSIEVTSIAAYPRQITNVDATAKALAKALKMKSRHIRQKLTAAKKFVWIKRQSTPKETAAVKKLKLDGIDFVPECNRFYPNTTLAAQALGFTGLDGDGLEGIEFFYNRDLKAEHNNYIVFKDALGNGFKAEIDPVTLNRGNNLVLTIDSNIQFISETALQETVDQYSARSGMVVVMQPKTGAILALAHYPFFNPNAYTDFSKELWRNRIITDAFEPGSTMKIFSAAAAIESGTITPNTIFYCENGAYRIGKNVVHDIKRHGWLSLQQIIKFSSNIGAVKVGEKIGPRRLYQTFRAFGFGEKTGFDSPGETAGSLSHYKHWSSIDTGAISFGHGISASALQLIRAVSAIANDGILMKPYIVQAVTDRQGRPIKTFKPIKIRRAISAQTAMRVKNIMRTVISKGGTGMLAALDGYHASGKTGTARKIDDSGAYSTEKHIASFVGFAPTENPEIAILVIIDEPQKKYYGGIVAAPVFKQIAQDALNYLGIPPRGTINKLRVARDKEIRG